MGAKSPGAAEIWGVIGRGYAPSASVASVFDAYAPEFVEDPYPTYARLRAESPVFFDETWGVTFFARHADVAGILRDRRFGRDVRDAVPPEKIDREVFDRIYPPQWPTWTETIRDSFIDLEPPRHTRIRRLVQWAFTRRASETYRDRMQVTTDAALDRAVEEGSMEAIGDFATPIPLTMIAELLGVPAADQRMLVEWSHKIVRVFDEACTAEEGDAAEAATKEFVAYCEELLADHGRNPRDDLVTALIDAEVDGDRLTEQELAATCILALNAGHEATVQAIGNGLLALAANPGEYERLRAEPGLMATGADELLRYDTPLQMFERWVLEDLEWNGTPLEQGSKVGLLFGSANHDEAVFEVPSGLDLGRAPNAHVSFGGGVHFCVGAPLAKVEMDVAFTTFAERIASFEVAAEELPRVPSLIFRGVGTLPLTLTPA
jgi:cytochrome P450